MKKIDYSAVPQDCVLSESFVRNEHLGAQGAVFYELQQDPKTGGVYLIIGSNGGATAYHVNAEEPSGSGGDGSYKSIYTIPVRKDL